MIGKVEISSINTSRLKSLKSDEMMELIDKAHAGDEDARQKLIEGNLKLVLSVIQKFIGRGENPDDLFQVGCIGLLKAIENFDTSLGLKFSTYGCPMIAGEIRRYLRDNSVIRVSRSMRDTAYKVMQCREQLMKTQSQEPTLDQIAAHLEIPRQEVFRALDSMSTPVSLYEPVYTEGGDSLMVMDQVRNISDSDEMWLDHIALRDALDALSVRERHIVDLRFFEGKTQMEVAAQIGISQAQVSRLEKGAIRAIRKAICVN